MIIEAADRMETEYLFANDISDELFMSAVERMESTNVIQDSDEILMEAADRMEREFLFSQRIPDEILIAVAAQMVGELNANPPQISSVHAFESYQERHEFSINEVTKSLRRFD